MGAFKAAPLVQGGPPQSQQRLEEWKDQLTAEGVKIREPQKKTAPNTNPIKDTLDSATIMLLVGVGAVLLLKR